MAEGGQISADIRTSLRSYISSPAFSLGLAGPFRDDDSFLEKGILDSTGVLELVGHIEKEYGIRVDADEIIPDNLDSIDKLTSFIERKTAAAGH